VGPDRDFGFAPRRQDIGVMILFLRNFANSVGKGQGIDEVGELEFFLKMMFVDDLPVVSKYLVQPLELRTL
jgi:hypothetical protein